MSDPFKRPFADVLLDQASGRTHQELTVKLHKLIGDVIDTGKKGTLTLTLSIEPLKDAEGMLTVHDAVTVKTPQRPRKPSTFFTTSDGNLSRDNPEQRTFDSLREVPAPKTLGGADAQATPTAQEA
jgi:hypothetical protein